MFQGTPLTLTVTGTVLYRAVDDEIDAVLLSDIVQDVSDVGVDDLEIDRLADKSGLAIHFALLLRRYISGPRQRWSVN